jgi:hypothetical protein
VSARVRLDWRGKGLPPILREAARRAIDDTTAAAAIQAKSDHPTWKNVTGTAEGSIRGDPARILSTVVRGLFGSFDVNYFIWLEIGARGRSGDRTLRRAADKEFPHLGRRLRAHYRQLAPGTR